MILTGGTCAFLITSAGQVIPAAVGTTAGAIITGVKLWVHADPVKVAIASAVGTGASSGAIAGAIVSKTATSAAMGAVIGAMSAGGIGSVIAGSIASISAASIASSPVGLLTVGSSSDGNQVTYNCWKPVLHDMSEEPSNGMLLKELLSHPNVDNVNITPGGCLPKIILENVWNEQFEIEYVVIQDSNKLCCHASPICT